LTNAHAFVNKYELKQLDVLQKSVSSYDEFAHMIYMDQVLDHFYFVEWVTMNKSSNI